MKSVSIKKPQAFGLAVQVQLQLNKPSQKRCVQTGYSGTNPSAAVFQRHQHGLDKVVSYTQENKASISPAFQKQ